VRSARLHPSGLLFPALLVVFFTSKLPPRHTRLVFSQRSDSALVEEFLIYCTDVPPIVCSLFDLFCFVLFSGPGGGENKNIELDESTYKHTSAFHVSWERNGKEFMSR